MRGLFGAAGAWEQCAPATLNLAWSSGPQLHVRVRDKIRLCGELDQTEEPRAKTLV